MDNPAMAPQGYPYPGNQYPGNPYPNMQGPPGYAPPPPPMYPAYVPPPPVVAPAPVIVQTITPHQQTNHALCCLICFLTGGLSVPCWIIACLTE